MSEVNLEKLGERSNYDQSTTIKTAMQEYDVALKECGFGLFHVRLMCAGFLSIGTGVVMTSTTSYVLPVAECDLNMNLVQKGLLNAMPYFGMVLTSVIAGFLVDTFGRKKFLVFGCGGVFVFTVISGLSQTYLVLLISKFCEGVLFAIAFTPIVTLTSELSHNGIRDRILMLQSSFASISQIVIALISYAILPQDWNCSFFNGKFVLHTWSFYLLLMSLWSFMSCLIYMSLPESPKYCITQKRYDEARETLIKIYKQNTGKPADTYPYANIWMDKTKLTIDETPEHTIEKSFSQMLFVGFHNVKTMFMKPLGLYLLLFSTMNYFNMNIYNIIRLWFPQLSTIVEHYATEDNQSLCGMLDRYTYDLKLRKIDNVTEVGACVPNVSGTETYINSIIFGSVCVIPYIISGVLVNKVGKKNLYIACGLTSVAVTLGLIWANTKIAMVALFSSDAALSQILMSLNQFLVVEHFPTMTRSLAIGMTMTIGRIGTLVGNVLFPILLDMGCIIPFYTLAGTMIFVTLLSLVIPQKKT